MDSSLGSLFLFTSIFAWGVNYLPRVIYLLYLSRPHVLLTPENSKLLFAQLEAQGGLPSNYRRPAVEVLETRPGTSWWQGVTLGQGEMTLAGPMVKLHRKFLALPQALQLAVLRHEIYEAHSKGLFKHWHATIAEYRILLSNLVRHWQRRQHERLQRLFPREPLRSFLGAA
jgi:hypothetical protein